jgi:hypothetical protein
MQMTWTDGLPKCICNSLISLEKWSSKMLLKINEQKKYITFTLSNPKKTHVKLLQNVKALREDKTPKNLGIMLDRRMTWTTHIIKTQTGLGNHEETSWNFMGYRWECPQKVIHR